MFQLPWMVSWGVVFTKQAQKDAKKIPASNLKTQTQRLLDILAINPFQKIPFRLLRPSKN
jgi:mRNA-degrading endonuclease RelE of RelBE toxin-antitoxin system